MNGREGPTARVFRVDVSPESARASAPPAARLTEDALLYGHRRAKGYSKVSPKRRTEPCVCGEDITAEVGWEAAAVDEHNLSDAHRKWRERVSA